MRLFRATTGAGIVAAVLAAAVIVPSARAIAQERTPQWFYEHAHFGEARALAQKQAAANPRDAVALAWLARTEAVAGDVKGAVATAERAIAANPNYAGGHMALAEALGAEAGRANILRQLPLARRAKKSLETAVALDPKDVDALNGLLQYYLQAPGIAGGSDEKAEAIAAQIAALDPSRGLIAQGVMAARRKQPERVEGFYLKALEANGKSVQARMSLANFYAGKPEKHAEAETHAKALLALDAALLTPYRVLAAVYARSRQWTELDAVLAQSDIQHPSNLLASFAAAQVLRGSGADLPRAERYIRRYLSQPPELGMPSHAVAHWQLGLVLEKAGRRDEARAAIQQALRMNRDLEQAKKDLKRVGGAP